MTLLLSAACAGRSPARPTAAPEAPRESDVPATAALAAARWTGTGAPGPTELGVALVDTAGGVTAVELVCGEQRQRLPLTPDGARVGGYAWFTGVAAGPCTIVFKGGTPARYTPVEGGQAWVCRILSTTAVCEHP